MELNLGLNHALDLPARIPASAGRKQNLRGAVARVGSARRDEVSNPGRERLDPEPKGRAGSTGPGRAETAPEGDALGEESPALVR